MRGSRSWLVLAGLLTLGGAAGGVLLVGCSGASTSPAPRPSVSQLSDGLTVLESVPSSHMNAAYKMNNHVIYLETRVGALKPEIYRQNFPNEPENEMDARVVDEEGRTFILVLGGDRLIDSSWARDIKAAVALPPADAARTNLYFHMARDAGDAFKAMGKPEIAPHVFHMVNATRFVPSEDAALNQRASERLKIAIANGAVTRFDTIGGPYLEGDLYGKCIFGCVAHHSNVWGWQGYYDFTNGTWNWNANVISCNHGTCSNDSSMSYQNESSFSGGSSNWIPSANTLTAMWSEESTTSNSTYTSGHGCQSGYNWDTPPGHECNDDSAYELWQIHDSPTNYGYGGSSKGNGSTFCATYGGNGNACACSSSCNSCSGDWGYPPAP